ANESVALRSACSIAFLPAIQLLVADGRTDPTAKRYISLKYVAFKPLSTIALLEHPKLRSDSAKNLLFYMAVMKGAVELISSLLQNRHIDPTFCNNLPLRKIQEKKIQSGRSLIYVQVEELLLKAFTAI